MYNDNFIKNRQDYQLIRRPFEIDISNIKQYKQEDLHNYVLMFNDFCINLQKENKILYDDYQ